MTAPFGFVMGRPSLDRDAFIAGPEAGLRLLWLAIAAVSIGALAARWSG